MKLRLTSLRTAAGAALLACVPLACLAAEPVSLGLASTVPATAETPRVERDLDAVLADARAAAKLDARLASPLRAKGDGVRYGTAGELVLELHPGGPFRFAFDGPLPTQRAFDGEVAWETDWAGLPTELDLGGREDLLLFAAALSGRWLDPKVCTVAFAAVDEGDDDDAVDADEAGTALDVRLIGGLERLTITLDPDTHLAAQLASPGSTWHLRENASPLGFPFPHELLLVEESGAEHRFRVKELARAGDLAPASFARPGLPDDHRFDATKPAELETMRASSGHLLVHPTLDGEDVGWFILDTGAGALCITPSVADPLGIEQVGTVTASGVGGLVQTKVRRGGSLAIGRLVLDEPTWVELDLDFLEPLLGVKIAGILGYDVFARSVVAIDYETPHVELVAPGEYELPSGATWQHLLLDDHLPCVEATLEGDRRGVFQIDTGATGTVTFHHAAVERWGLLDGRETATSRHGGVGGFRAIATGELDWFELAGRRFEPIDAAFEPEPSTLWSSACVSGTLGGALISPFTMVLDHVHRKIAFVPREN